VKKLTIFMLAAMVAAIPAYAVKYVAVVETEVDGASGAKINKAEVRLITAALRGEAVKNLPKDKYNIMTQETVMSQSGAVLEECADENCVVTLGSKIGADYVVRGIISKLGNNLTISVEMYETNDGNLVESSGPVRAVDANELLDKAAGACGEMYRRFESAMGSITKQKAATEVVAQQSGNQVPTPVPVSPPQPQYQQSSASTQSTMSTSSTITPQTPTKPPTIDASGMLTDNRDGKRYKTVVIDGKRWMGENLNYQTTSGSWCYKNDYSKCNVYGRLYDWNTAKTVCPGGWHLPSRQEWNDLEKAAGGRKAGKNLKSKSGWDNRGNGTDKYGFSALPGGYRDSFGDFINAGNYGNWWTATEYDGSYAYSRGMDYDLDGVYEYYDSKSYGRSVRCVADN